MSCAEWCTLSDEALGARDIAETNLTIARGLPGGAENLDVESFLAKLDQWAGYVAKVTDRNLQQFHRDPSQSNHSLAQFRMLCMATVLPRDLGVHYDPESMTGDFDASDSSRLFIHGPLMGRGGTCVNLPVLFLAVGRRLGYPLKLVGAVEHLFVRWVGDDGERFNIEATSRGFNSMSDDDYRSWPVKMSARDLARGTYLRDFTPREELATFLRERARCHLDNLQVDQSLEYLAMAARLSDRHRGDLIVGQHVGAILRLMPSKGSCQGPLWQAMIEDLSAPIHNPIDAWAVPIAQREVSRILRCRGGRESSGHSQGEQEAARAISLDQLYTEIIA